MILVGSWSYIAREQGRHIDELKNLEVLRVTRGSNVLGKHLQVIANDVRYISEHLTLQHTVSVPSPFEIHHFEEVLETLLGSRKVYDQARWIDATGKEVVRVNFEEGRAVVVPPEKLAFKGDRYYFTEAIKGQVGQFYLSQLDLNMENGLIEQPIKPTIRIATVVNDRQGNKAGIVILNYLADDMLRRFAVETNNGRDNFALTNAQGYWLYAPNPQDAWGFMFNDTSRSLAKRNPSSWSKMQGLSGQFEDEQGLWTYASLDPLASLLGSSDRASYQGTNNSEALTDRWIIVSHYPRAELLTNPQRSSTWKEWALVFMFLLVVAYVIWGRVRSAVALYDSEQRFRAVFDYAMVGMATTSLDKGWLSVNPALCRMLGYEPNELVTKNWVELTHPDDLAADIANFESVLRGESDGYLMEKRFLRKDGSVVHTVISVRVIRKTNGDVDCFSAVIEDVSNWVLAEQQWSSSVDTLQRFLDHFPGAAYVKDTDSRIVVASRGFNAQLGLDPKNMVGRLSSEVFVGEFGQKILADDARVLAAGKTEVIDEEFNDRHYQSTKFVIPKSDGLKELGGITIDVTERYLSQVKLEKQIRRSAILLELPKKAEALTEKEFMQFALECAEELTESKIGFIHFVNDDGVSIELVAWSRNTLEKYCTAAFDSHYPIQQAGIWADAARTRQPVVVNDYSQATNKQGLPEGHSHLQRFLSIPVTESDAVRMMTGVGNKDSDYDDFDVETVLLIGNETWRIVRRQRAERALQIAMHVVNASPVVCFRWATTDGWPVVFVSDNVSQWGYSVGDLLANRPPFAEIIHPDDLARVAAEVAAKTKQGEMGYEQEYRVITAGNKVIWVIDRTIVQRDSEGSAIFYDGVLTDVTEQKNQQLRVTEALSEQKKLNKRLEEAHNQLLQSEKMASIGQLAAGVAHELNNPIGFVHSNLGTLDGYVHDLMEIIAAYEALAGAPDHDVAREAVKRLIQERDFSFLKDDIFSLLAESKDGLGRVRKIVEDLKSFSRVGEQDWKEADLHQGIDSTLNIVWNELKYKATVVKEYGDLPPVFCLISQLNQVFMNLLVNASHAIETQGAITIRTRRHGEENVCVEITDTGKGIAPEHLNRIFDPFFTTKPVGKGTGLGLSLSYSIVERHQGFIEVDSELGVGSTFRVVLPIQPKPTANNQKTETS